MAAKKGKKGARKSAGKKAGGKPAAPHVSSLAKPFTDRNARARVEGVAVPKPK